MKNVNENNVLFSHSSFVYFYKHIFTSNSKLYFWDFISNLPKKNSSARDIP